MGLEAVVPLGLLDVAIHDIPEFGDDPPHRHFDIRFTFRIIRGTPRPGPGVAAIKWIRLDEFDQEGVDQGVIRAAKKIEESSASMRASTTPGR